LYVAVPIVGALGAAIAIAHNPLDLNRTCSFNENIPSALPVYAVPLGLAAFIE
jgi:hypothetical protein